VVVPEVTRQKWVNPLAGSLVRTSALTPQWPLPPFFVVICKPSRYVLRRQQLLAEGVDPADLSVFAAALTRGLSANKRVTNAAVAVRHFFFVIVRAAHLSRTLTDCLFFVFFGTDAPNDVSCAHRVIRHNSCFDSNRNRMSRRRRRARPGAC
jgi:hypothetical protein